MFPDSPAEGAPPQRNCPAIDAAGRSYFAVANRVVAFDGDAAALRQVWAYETGGRIPGSPVVGADGRIRVHSEDGYLHVIGRDGQRGGPALAVGEPLGFAAPLVDSSGNTWICGYHGGLWQVGSGPGGEPLMYFRGRQRLDSTGVIRDGVLYVGAENSCVYAIPLGESRGRNTWNHLQDEGRTGWFINSALALAGGPTLVVASRDDRLYGFGLDGKKLWSTELPGQVLGAPVVAADDSVYVGLSVSGRGERPSGALVRIDGVSHKQRWQYETEAAIESTPVLGDDGSLYFGDNAGFVHAVGQDGRPLWVEPVGAAVRSPGAILAGGLVVFGLEDGRFVALRGNSRTLMPGAWAKYLGNAAQNGAAAP